MLWIPPLDSGSYNCALGIVTQIGYYIRFYRCGNKDKGNRDECCKCEWQNRDYTDGLAWLKINPQVVSEQYATRV